MKKYAIKQLSIFVENKAGELTDITTLISKNNISFKSINLVDANEFGILRVIVDDSEKTKKVLDDEGFSLTITDVLAVEIDDHVGSFNEVITELSSNNINIEYTYTINNNQKGAFIFKVASADLLNAAEILHNSNIKILEEI